VVASGEDWKSVVVKAEMAVVCVVREVTNVGLKVAAQKIEALYFYSRTWGKPPRTYIRVSGTRVLVGGQLKYLGLLLDGQWKFGPHFEALAPRVARFSAALGRILPNLGAPDG